MEELRRDPDLLEIRTSEEGGTRFVGPTEPALALKYFREKTGQFLECGPVFGKFLKILQEEGYQNLHGLDFVDMLYFPYRKNRNLSFLSRIFHDAELGAVLVLLAQPQGKSAP